VKWGKVNGSIIHPLEAISERPDLVIEENDDEELKVKKEAKVLEWTEWQSRNTDQTLEEGRKLVKIASGANFLLALRANGEVWACSVSDQIIGQWVYVSQSPVDKEVRLI
jgi:SCF-associated factor 1